MHVAEPEGIVEIRVHGVSGTPPEDMLGDPHPEAVDGDDLARFYRRRDKVATHPLPARTVEAFHWGRMTACSPTRALWLLLAPFGLVNLARYTLPMRMHGSTELGIWPRRVADLALRLVGLALTLLLLTNVAFVAMDLLAWQCAGTAQCVSRASWMPFRDDGSNPYGLRLLVALVAPALLIAMLWWLGRQVYLYRPPEAPGTPAANEPPRKWENEVGSLDAAWFWHTCPRAPILRTLHVVAAIGLLALLVSLSTLSAPQLAPWAPGVLKAAAVVAFASLVLAAILTAVGWQPRELERDPRGEDPIKLPGWLAAWRDLSLAGMVLVAGVAVWAAWHPAKDRYENLPAFEVTLNVLYLTLLLMLPVLAVAIAILKAKTRNGNTTGAEPTAAVPRRFRTLWHGYGAVMITSVAVLLASGFTAGTAMQVTHLIGKQAFLCTPPDCPRDPIAVPDVYQVTAIVWGCLAALLVAALLVWLLGMAAGQAARWIGKSAPGDLMALIRGQYSDAEANGANRTFAKVAKAWRRAALKFLAPRAVTGLAAAGMTVLVGQAIYVTLVLANDRPGFFSKPWQLAELEPSAGWRQLLVILNDAGAWLVTGVVLGLVFIGMRAFRSPQWRRSVGILWDLLAFWPRLAHPIAPPPYGGRAVLALAKRAAAHASKVNVRAVVLSGHSQGSLVSAATVCYLSAVESKTVMSKVCLLTYGSQLQWAFPRLFPAYIGHSKLVEVLHTQLGGRWYNLHRWTDPLGSVVLAYPLEPAKRGFTGQQWPTATSRTKWGRLGEEEPVDQATGDPDVRQIGNEIQLRDPMWMGPQEDRPSAPILAHSGYYDDPAFDKVVAMVVNQTPA